MNKMIKFIAMDETVARENISRARTVHVCVVCVCECDPKVAKINIYNIHVCVQCSMYTMQHIRFVSARRSQQSTICNSVASAVGVYVYSADYTTHTHKHTLPKDPTNKS